MAVGNVTPRSFAVSLLQGVGAPVTPANLKGIVGWEKAEGGNWNNDATYNPLNTTQPAPGAGNTGTQGNIKQYRSWQQGLNATIATLKNGDYGGILSALRAGNNPGAIASAIGASPWGTNGSLVAQTIANSSLGPGGAVIGGATAVPGNVARTARVRSTMTTNPHTDVQSAAIASLLNPPTIDPSGKVSSNDPLGRLMQNIVSGAYTTPGSTASATSALITKAARDKAGAAPSQSFAPGAGDINPLSHHGWTLTETDMGVDASAPAGTPILAMNDSRVVSIVPNWYSGQPFVTMKIMSGPNAGKYWYVSEQITGIPKVGQTIRRGQTVARFASSGTGIETGWASGVPGQTLAQAQDSSSTIANRHAAGTPQGIDFSKRVVHHSPVSIG